MTKRRLLTGVVLASVAGMVLAACQPSKYLPQDAKTTETVELETTEQLASPQVSATPAASPSGPGQTELDAMDQADQATDPTVYGSSSFETQLNF